MFNNTPYFLNLSFVNFVFQSNKTYTQEANIPNQQSISKIKTQSIVLGMGCFWGAEKCLAGVQGVIDVESGYAGGEDKQAGYQKILLLEKQIQLGQSTAPNHAEVIKVTFNPDLVDLEGILISFWENHDPYSGQPTRQ